MNGGTEPEAARPRPLSGGLWTLFSWLRRDDHSSTDSLSSVGSDRTVASFAFLAPGPPFYSTDKSPIPPLAPATDTYKKRLRERNLRRQHDRDLTLHRKYGLYRGDGGYDAFSLPHVRRVASEPVDRDRRATSECYQRPAAHVPGKRRAPQPPLLQTSSLNRRHSRKRPAPPPPVTFTKTATGNNRPLGHREINILPQMNSKSKFDKQQTIGADVSMEKYVKKDTTKNAEKARQLRTEKSFLKQIFDSRKRNSTVDPAPNKLLPSISELDKEAAEIIESCKLRALEQKNNAANNNYMPKDELWCCTRCLKKYNTTIETCLYCVPEEKINLINKNKEVVASNTSNCLRINAPITAIGASSSSRVSGVGSEEKQKLKAMLKEMKDSLPKKSKTENNVTRSVSTQSKDMEILQKTENVNRSAPTVETPTLRIGSFKTDDLPETSLIKPTLSFLTISEQGKNSESVLSNNAKEVSGSVVVTQPVVLLAPVPQKLPDKEVKLPRVEKMSIVTSPITENRTSKNVQLGDKNYNKSNKLGNVPVDDKTHLHTPLKISSLLNPVYVPKNNNLEGSTKKFVLKSESKTPIIQHNIKENENLISASTSTADSSLCNLANKLPLKERNGTQINLLRDIDSKSNSGVVKETPIPKPAPVNERPQTDSSINILPTSNAPLSLGSKNSQLSNIGRLSAEQYSRRRGLINQLEQSIAKGDERAAAEAAIKLAQLKLSCSVLSFSSQIAGGGDISKIFPRNKQEKTTNTNNYIQQPRLDQSIEKTSKATETVAPAKEKKIVATADKQEKIDTIRTGQPQPSTSGSSQNEHVSIEVWVEDREATRGPLRLRVPRLSVLSELRRQAEASLGVASRLQRWIIGRTLCTNDNTSLASLAGKDLSAPFYLCIVESENNAEPVKQNKPEESSSNLPPKATDDNVGNVYSELVQLEQRALVPNAEPFECAVCMEECASGRGAVLRDCVHCFCENCLSDLVRHCEEPIVTCPAMGCPGILQEREIRMLVSNEEYERWLARGLAAAESGSRNAFHCRTRDCTGWAMCDPGVQRFPCPVCKHTNCIPCSAIHEGETCEQHQKKIQASKEPQADEGTQALLDTLISKGEALRCPECRAIITKKWGCDWVKCSACKTEICWVTRGRRWGAGGRGDTSGGCRCGVDGKKCHPSCGYCH